jgi:two-component system alkaline phosphatase synthesis response regulator PhoP
MGISLILITEDEADVCEMLTMLLEKDGYEVSTACDGKSAIDAVNLYQPDLLVLDWNLPDKDGLTICRELRESGFESPIMLLTARDAEFDKVLAFSAGADDYVTKPFGMFEFLSRIKALLRRHIKNRSIMQIGDLSIDPSSHQVNLGPDPISLTPKEYNLLVFLAENAERAVTRETLLHEVWGYSFYGNTRTVDVHISRLRSKLGDDNCNPARILTVKTVGYKLVPFTQPTAKTG